MQPFAQSVSKTNLLQDSRLQNAAIFSAIPRNLKVVGNFAIKHPCFVESGIYSVLGSTGHEKDPFMSIMRLLRLLSFLFIDVLLGFSQISPLHL